MHSRLARLLVRMYPRQWRERYGDEFLSLINESGLGWRQAWNVVVAAAEERTMVIVRRVLGKGREDAVIRRIARRVVQFASAWFAAGAVYAVFPVVAIIIRVALGLSGWDLVGERARETWTWYGEFLVGSWAPVLLALIAVLVAPIVFAFKATRAGHSMPVTARVATVAGIVLAGLACQVWLVFGLRWLPMLHMGLSLTAGGTVIAFALFPRLQQELAIKPPGVVPA